MLWSLLTTRCHPTLAAPNTFGATYYRVRIRHRDLVSLKLICRTALENADPTINSLQRSEQLAMLDDRGIGVTNLAEGARCFTFTRSDCWTARSRWNAVRRLAATVRLHYGCPRPRSGELARAWPSWPTASSRAMLPMWRRSRRAESPARRCRSRDEKPTEPSARAVSPRPSAPIRQAQR